MPHLLPLLAFCFFGIRADDKNELPTLQNKIEPDWGDLTTGYITEMADVEVSVSPSGLPFSLSSEAGVPDPVVRAIMTARFSKYVKDGRDLAFSTVLKVPIRRKPDSDFEYRQAPYLADPEAYYTAEEVASRLNAKKAASMMGNLPKSESPKHPRSALLIYYSTLGPAEVENAKTARRKLLGWLVENDPKNGILACNCAIVNREGEPLADREASAALEKEWLEAVERNPQDQAVLINALRFLRAADPAAAVTLASQKLHGGVRSAWLGYLGAVLGMGIRAIDPVSGKAMASSLSKLPGEGLAEAARNSILVSSDLRIVLSAMRSTTLLASELSEHGTLPTNYPEYCEGLLSHARKLYPQVSAQCNQTNTGKTAPVEMTEAKLKKRVQPQYPAKAKAEHVQGQARFTAMIGKDGHIRSLELLSTPVLLYEESYAAIRQWEYKPVMLAGEPVEVQTEIVVNFSLEQ